MLSICAGCQQVKGQVPPLDNPDVTHGLCSVCAVLYFPTQEEVRNDTITHSHGSDRSVLAGSAHATTLADLVTGGGTLTTSGGLTFSHFTAALETFAVTGNGMPLVEIHTTSVSTLATLTAETLGPDAIAFRGFQWTATMDPLTETPSNTNFARMTLSVGYDVTGLGVDARFPYGPRVNISRPQGLGEDRAFHFVNVTSPSGATLGLSITSNVNVHVFDPSEFHPSDTLPVGTTRVSVQESITLYPLSQCFQGFPGIPASCESIHLGVNPSRYPFLSGPAVGAVFTTFETAPLTVSSVPEPATWLLLATGLFVTFSVREVSRWKSALS